jgi:hypothetical protein
MGSGGGGARRFLKSFGSPDIHQKFDELRIWSDDGQSEDF